MSFNKKIVMSVSGAVLVLSFFGAGSYFLISRPPLSSTESVLPAASLEPVVSPLPTVTEYQFVASESGQLAIEVLQAHATITTKDYGAAGQFVTSINGLAADNQHYWAFYVNNAYAETGASQTKLKKDDMIKFVYEAVTLTP